MSCYHNFSFPQTPVSRKYAPLLRIMTLTDGQLKGKQMNFAVFPADKHAGGLGSVFLRISVLHNTIHPNQACLNTDCIFGL
jgi:hypothetical protein